MDGGMPPIPQAPIAVSERAAKRILRITAGEPDGTVLRIPLPNGDLVSDDDDAPMTPEEIERVLAAMDAIIPFERTPEEEARLEADRLARKEWEKAHFFEHADKLAGMWK